MSDKWEFEFWSRYEGIDVGPYEIQKRFGTESNLVKIQKYKFIENSSCGYFTDQFRKMNNQFRKRKNQFRKRKNQFKKMNNG